MSDPKSLTRRHALALLGALVLGVSTFLGGRHYLAERAHAIELAVAERHARERIIVASTDLAAGTVLAAEQLAARGVPAPYVPSSAARIADLERVAGHRLVHGLRAGDPILWSTLADPDRPAFSAQLEPGRRALTFPVDDVNAFAGLLAPGDVIDLLYSSRADGRSIAVRPLLQHVAVLATGTTTRVRTVREASGEEREVPAEYATITLEVTPDDAQKIILAQRSGELTAVLRHPADAAPVPARAMDARALDGTSVAAAVRAPRVLPDFVEVIVGGGARAERSRESVDAPAEPGTARAASAFDPGSARARLGIGDPAR